MTVGAAIAEGIADPPTGVGQGDRSSGGGTAGGGRPRPGLRRPIPARVLRRTAAADRDRPRAGGGALVHRVRRAGVRARRVGAGPGAQPAGRSPARPRADLPLHRPRSRGGAADRATGGGHVSRARSSRKDRPRRCCSAPRHPYTVALLSAVPEPDPARQRARIVLRGDLPSPSRPPSGCPFHPRCFHPRRDERCRTEPPALRPVGGTFAACHYAETTQADLARPSSPTSS